MDRLPRVREMIENGIGQGLHLGAQIFVHLDGETVADAALGENRPGVPLRPDHLLLWFSATKAVTTVCIAQEWERGRIDLDAPVARYLPEFAQHRKEAVTLRHVLTHTGGFRWLEEGDVDFSRPWEEVIDQICRMPLEPGWVVGQTAGYHPMSGFYVLGEVVQRVAMEPFPQYVRRHVCEPLGMRDSWIGVPGEQYDTYEATQRIGAMYDTAGGKREATTWTTYQHVQLPSPSSGGFGPVRELARLYIALLNGGELGGQRVLEPETIDLFTARHREGVHDATFQYPMDFGLGFILEDPDRRGRMPYGYGRHASPNTFGHSGMQCCSAFCDPDRRLVVGLIFNGLPGEVAHQRRVDPILTTLYEELGLAG